MSSFYTELVPVMQMMEQGLYSDEEFARWVLELVLKHGVLNLAELSIVSE